MPSLAEFGVDRAAFDAAAAGMAAACVASGSHANNPRVPDSPGAIEGLFKDVYAHQLRRGGKEVAAATNAEAAAAPATALYVDDAAMEATAAAAPRRGDEHSFLGRSAY